MFSYFRNSSSSFFTDIFSVVREQYYSASPRRRSLTKCLHLTRRTRRRSRPQAQTPLIPPPTTQAQAKPRRRPRWPADRAPQQRPVTVALSLPLQHQPPRPGRDPQAEEPFRGQLPVQDGQRQRRVDQEGRRDTAFFSRYRDAQPQEEPIQQVATILRNPKPLAGESDV
jgi:hypothetical protein